MAVGGAEVEPSAFEGRAPGVELGRGDDSGLGEGLGAVGLGLQVGEVAAVGLAAAAQTLASEVPSAHGGRSQGDGEEVLGGAAAELELLALEGDEVALERGRPQALGRAAQVGGRPDPGLQLLAQERGVTLGGGEAPLSELLQQPVAGEALLGPAVVSGPVRRGRSRPARSCAPRS